MVVLILNSAHDQQEVFEQSSLEDFVTVRFVSYSADVGWMPIVESSCNLVNPIRMATA